MLCFWITGKGSATFHAMCHLVADRSNRVLALRANEFREAKVQRYEEERRTNDKGKNKIARADAVSGDGEPNQATGEKKETA